MHRTLFSHQIFRGTAGDSPTQATSHLAISDYPQMTRIRWSLRAPGSAAGILLIAFSGLALLSGCGPGDTARASVTDDLPETERYGGTAVIGFTVDIDEVNPVTFKNGYAQDLQRFVLFTPLLRYNEGLEAEPYGAESWEVNADTTELTFHLRRDLLWHDGRPTTAFDWKFSYDLARDARTAFLYPTYWSHYGEAQAVDSFTFRVKMRPHAEFLDPWTAFSPVPKHILAGVDPAGLKSHPYSHTRPVGNGPFRFVSRTPGQSWTFEANPAFPAALGGRPYLDRLIYRTIPEKSTLLTELLTGGIDFYMLAPADHAERIRTSGKAGVVDYLDRSYAHVEWNHRRPPFDDPRVRRALTLAIDRPGIVDAVRHGYAEVANSPVPPTHWQYDATAGGDLGYDPEEARRLLAEAGYLDRDGDGIVESAAGTPFRFALSVPSGVTERIDMAQIIQADLKKVGVGVRVHTEEFNTLAARVFDVEKRAFDAAIFTNPVEFRADDTDNFHCDRRNQPMNMVGYCNPAVDRLLDTLPMIADRAIALPLWRKYQRAIAEDQPYTFLFYARNLNGVSNRLQNVRPDARGDWAGLDRWWIAPEQRGTKRTAQRPS